ncbi:hypothetical protein PybrP1_003934, partial [[Pythium] brassicae (nom. inval.)]
MVRAARRGHLEAVQCLLEQFQKQTRPRTWSRVPGKTWSSEEALGAAILSGHFEIAKYLVDHDYHQPGRAVYRQVPYDAVSGNLAMIKWLRDQQLAGKTTHWLDGAASVGHLDIIKWIHENMPKDASTPDAMNGAASGGHLEVVQWLHENRREGCTTHAMNNAAKNDHLKVLQWLQDNRSEGCTTQAMDGAAQNGHLEIVQWLHAN